MASEINLYVYRITQEKYGAGLGRETCERLGRIVESWPLNTPEQASFLARHGSSYAGAYDRVTKLAELVYELLILDPSFQLEIKPPMTLRRVYRAIRDFFR